MTRVVVRGFRLPGMVMVGRWGGGSMMMMMEETLLAWVDDDAETKARLRKDEGRSCSLPYVEMMVGRVAGEKGVDVWHLARWGRDGGWRVEG